MSGVRVCWYKGACEGVCIRDYLELYIIILYNMCSSSVGVYVRVRVFVCVGVRVCWYMGAYEGVCMCDYLELYIIILYNMCSY